MKKLLVLLLLFIPVSAKGLERTVYFPYSEYGEFSDVKIPGSDLIDVLEERRYLWYNEVEKGDFYLEGEGLYSKLNYDKKKVTEFSPWSKVKPIEHKSRLIEEKKMYDYQDMEKVNKIVIKNIGGVDRLYVSEIEIFNKDEKLSYGSYCFRCNLDMSGISNGVINENTSYINSDGFLEIQVSDYYDINDLKINVYLYDDTNNKKSFGLFLGQQDIDFVGSYSVTYFTSNSITDIKKIEFSVKDFTTVNPIFKDVVTSDEEVKSSLTRKVKNYNLYRYQDTMIYYYDLIKNYSSAYSKDKPSNYVYKDQLKFKDYYKSRSRDKVIVEDNAVLTSKDVDLKKYVVFSTIKDFKINDYINFDRNGKYKIEYIFNENVVPIDVNVDIKKEEVKKTVKKSSLSLFVIITFALLMLVMGFIRHKKANEK